MKKSINSINIFRMVTFAISDPGPDRRGQLRLGQTWQASVLQWARMRPLGPCWQEGQQGTVGGCNIGSFFIHEDYCRHADRQHMAT
jgi:hypothetical protein